MLTGGDRGAPRPSPAPFADFNALREAANEGLELHGGVAAEEGQGGEANREAPTSPAAEQVADRAYPRSYVSDRRARQELRAFKAIPTEPAPTAYRSKAAFEHAAHGAGHRWHALGPTTPNVAGTNSQFFDPATLTGPKTQESGRVTALAIDPACAPGACRMWVAAAGGGIWRTDDALAGTPGDPNPKVQWTAPPSNLPTNAFGSLYYDSTSQVLYAGSGEPNGSGDSEAGLGLFRSSDFGATWHLVPGSASVATDRSIGAIAVDPTDPDTIYIGTDVARHGSSAVNGGRRTPPNAPQLGVYRSTDGGQKRRPRTLSFENGSASTRVGEAMFPRIGTMRAPVPPRTTVSEPSARRLRRTPSSTTSTPSSRPRLRSPPSGWDSTLRSG